MQFTYSTLKSSASAGKAYLKLKLGIDFVPATYLLVGLNSSLPQPINKLPPEVIDELRTHASTNLRLYVRVSAFQILFMNIVPSVITWDFQYHNCPHAFQDCKKSLVTYHNKDKKEPKLLTYTYNRAVISTTSTYKQAVCKVDSNS